MVPKPLVSNFQWAFLLLENALDFNLAGVSRNTNILIWGDECENDISLQTCFKMFLGVK